MTPVRDRIHRLVDQLPEAELPEVESLLTERRDHADPFLSALANAPEDDEPLTDEDIAALDEAYADVAAGRVVSHEEARRRLLGEP
jgi:predicted transcriptional regulator